MNDIISPLAFGFGMHNFALAVTRVAVGAFFFFSGYHKLFNRERHAGLVDTFRRDRVPFITFNQWWVPFWEFIGGAMVALGLFTAWSAGVLAVICIVACICEAREKVDSYKPIDVCDRIDDYLYLPEVLYVVLLTSVVFAGPGQFSLDALLWH